MDADRIRVPRLLSRERTMWLSLGAAAVGVVAVCAFFAVTQPSTAPYVAVVVVLLAVGCLYIAGQRTWIDRSHGAVVREVFFRARAPITWRDAQRVGFTDNRAGTLLLEVRGAGRRSSTYLPVVAVDTGGDRSQPPALLRLLADEVERWAPDHQRDVVEPLRAQAEHLEAGGDVRTSPLGRRISRRAREPRS